jgi:hypothetical protein
MVIVLDDLSNGFEAAVSPNASLIVGDATSVDTNLDGLRSSPLSMQSKDRRMRAISIIDHFLIYGGQM